MCECERGCVRTCVCVCGYAGKQREERQKAGTGGRLALKRRKREAAQIGPKGQLGKAR